MKFQYDSFANSGMFDRHLGSETVNKKYLLCLDSDRTEAYLSGKGLFLK